MTFSVSEKYVAMQVACSCVRDSKSRQTLCVVLKHKPVDD